MKSTIFGLEPINQSYGISLIGKISALIILYALTNGFDGVDIPKEYDVLIGK